MTNYILIAKNLEHPVYSIICASHTRTEMEEEKVKWEEDFSDEKTHEFEITEYDCGMTAFYEDFIEDANETIMQLSMANKDANEEIKHLKAQIEELKK